MKYEIRTIEAKKMVLNGFDTGTIEETMRP